MLIAADGRRAGTISGGCLEGEVARKAMWRTEKGPLVRRYSTIAEDGEVPYGMGCGGVIHLLLERSETAGLVMERLAASFMDRTPLAIATVLDGEDIGLRAFCSGSQAEIADNPLSARAWQGFSAQLSFVDTAVLENGLPATVRVEYHAARPGLFVFGAGDDAIPLVKLARQLGWYVALADGRSHLATQARFPEAHDVQVLTGGKWPDLGMRPSDAAAVMTHSLQQDTFILSKLLQEDLTYIGVLGPRRRTDEILATLAEDVNLTEFQREKELEAWHERIFAPMGLDLGGDNSADIALAVVAEIQQQQHRASALSLRHVRISAPRRTARTHGVSG